MTLTELRYLVALARERHFGHAAQVCNVSQPTLSAAIKKLEEQLGMPLFERRPREVVVTPIVALPFSGGGLVRAQMYEESFSVLLPGDHPWTKQKQIQPEQMLDETLLLLGEGHCFRDQVLELCPAIDSERQRNLVQIEGGSLETLRHMVASGLGITVLPNSALYQHGYDKSTFAVRPFAAPVPSRTIALVWRDSFPRPKAIEVLRHAVPREGLAA